MYARCEAEEDSKCQKEIQLRVQDGPTFDVWIPLVPERNTNFLGSCAACGQSEPDVQMYRCAVCHLVCYCSRACQRVSPSSSGPNFTLKVSSLIGICIESSVRWSLELASCRTIQRGKVEGHHSGKGRWSGFALDSRTGGVNYVELSPLVYSRLSP